MAPIQVKERKVNEILERIYHAGNHIRQYAVIEAKVRMKKRHSYKELYDAIDELAAHNKEQIKRKDD